MILEEETFKEFGYYPDDLKPKSNKKILAACDDCGKVRVTTKKNHALCRSCAQKGERCYMFGMRGENTPNWKGGLVKRICEACGKEFDVKPSEIKKGWGRFCSRACATTGEKHPKWKGGKVKRICEICGKEFEAIPSVIKRGYGKFCSLSCAANALKRREKRICEICGKEFEAKTFEIKRGYGRFCSRECFAKSQVGENNPSWKGGISFEPYCEKFDFAFKEYIREKFGRICFLCPKTEEENGKRLSVHHVNYNKDCGCDGDLTCQFVPLCLSCNSKANFNREEWTEKIMNMLHNSLNGWYI